MPQDDPLERAAVRFGQVARVARPGALPALEPVGPQQSVPAGLPVGDDFGEFYRAVEWIGLQRHLKILGIFARLTLRDGKPKYLADAPRFVQYARHTAARYRALGPFMVLLDHIEGNETRVGYTF